MFLPPEIITVLGHFRPHFTRPTFQKMVWLFSGVILTRSRHTISAALRYLGLANNPNFARFHQLLNRARYSTLLLSRILLAVLLQQFVGPDQEVTLVIDETLERWWGRKLSKRGHWRDSLLSSGGLNVTNSGLRWLVIALAVKVPWSPLYWALPFLTAAVLTPKTSQKLEVRHKTVLEVAGQLIRRWWPRLKLRLVGDSAYSAIKFGHQCRKT